MFRNALPVFALASLISGFQCSRCAASETGSTVDPALRCNSLQGEDFSHIQDASTQLTNIDIVPEFGAVSAFCRVRGYIWPQVGVEIHLPLSNWNGKLIAVGTIGWGGEIGAETCNQHLRRGYACVTTDTGHKGRGDDESWAANNLQAQVDFGFRAIHVATLAAKAIVQRYYTKPPRKAYFIGCSTGGFEGMGEAQRFPWDFDGIVAGAPDMDEADLTLRQLWAQRAYFDGSGKPILDVEALALLHAAVLAQCDMDDGVRDGIIGNPMVCSLDPMRLRCKSQKGSGCLSDVQVEAAKKIYNGPPYLDGRAAIRGALPGSELLWNDKSVGFSFDAAYFDGFFEHMIYGAGPNWTSTSVNFDRDVKRLGMAALYSNTNPDLRRFKAAGGKLITYQGGSDITEIPGAIADYYQTVERVMGGREPTQDFFRLFIVPGMNHCGGGIGAYAIDYLSYLEAWVEEGKAPDSMMGAHISDSYLASLPSTDELVSSLPVDSTMALRVMIAARRLQFPLDPAMPISFTRPVYPFPLYAKYAGGDNRKAESFRPAQR